MNSEADALALLTALRNQAFNFKSHKDQAQALQEDICRFYRINQGKTDSCQADMDGYKNGRQVITHIGEKLPVCSALVDADLKANGLYCASATTKQIDASERGL